MFIDSVSGIQQSPPNVDVVVFGRVTGCVPVGGIINLQVICGSLTFSGTGQVQSGSIFWNGTVQTTCACNGPITVIATATCPDTSTCSVTVNLPNISCCCPTINSFTTTESTPCIQPQLPGCSGGFRQINFTVTGTVPANCNATIRIVFGDSQVGIIHPLAAGPFTIQEPHVYCVGASYNAMVTIITPTGCQGTFLTVTPSPCPDCTTQNSIRTLCNLIEIFFLAFSMASLALLYAGLNGGPACPPYVLLGNLFGGVAAVLLAVYTSTTNNLKCILCACNPFPKWLGMILLGGGICTIMFVPPGCGSVTFVVPLLFIVVGAFFLYLWYFNYKDICPLTICHFCAAVRLTGLVALIAIGFIYAVFFGLITTGAFWIAVITAGVVTLVAQYFIDQNTPPNANNCQYFP